MTREEVLTSVNVIELVRSRGIRANRSGMVCCPFHGDKRPSMKVYKDGFKCFACGENGNAIDFVMKYDGLSFKDAFIYLGGTYETMTRAERVNAELHRQEEARKRAEAEERERKIKSELSYLISLCRKGVEISRPCSNDWCVFKEELDRALRLWTYLYIENEEVSKDEILGIYKRIRQAINTVTGVA